MYDVVQLHFHCLRWRDRDCWNHSRGQYDSKVIVNDIRNKKCNKITRMHWCYYTLEIKFQHWKTHRHRHILKFQTALTMTALLPQGSVLPCLKLRVCLLSSFSTARLNLGVFVPCKHPHRSVKKLQPFSLGSLSHTLFVQESAMLSIIEPNATTATEAQPKSGHFLSICPQVYSTQSKKTTKNPMCVLPLLHDSCISSCHPP